MKVNSKIQTAINLKKQNKKQPKPCQPTPPPPPVCPPPQTKVNGSAGLFGDPMFALFTPNVQASSELRSGVDTGLKHNQTVNVLTDKDGKGLAVNVTGTQVNPFKDGTVGVGTFEVKTNAGKTVKVTNNGDVTLDGKLVGNVNTSPNGMIDIDGETKVGFSQEIDNTAGDKAKRVVVSNNEYKVTAALRKPTGANAYFDMNFEELTNNASDNATGYTNTNGVGIATLLKMEP